MTWLGTCARIDRVCCGLALWLLLCGAGCGSMGGVHRRVTIRSNPPGAMVYVDNFEIGTTPVATDFVYYGTREIRLVKDGFETKTQLVSISPPWYQYFPVDFVAENLIPYEIRDERQLAFNLEPQRIVPTEELLGRADDLRQANFNLGDTPPLGEPVAPVSAPPAVAPGVEAIPPGMRLPN